MKLLNFIIILCLFLSSYYLKSYVSISDTTIKTDLISFPVYGYTEDWAGKTITYTFEEVWHSFEILDVVGGDAVLDANIKYGYDYKTHLITITINSMQPNYNGLLFNIVLRVLARVDFYYPNERCIIIPKEIIINDKGNLTNIELDNDTAEIKLNYVPSNLTYIQDVSLNYPNPFYYETNILFSLNEPNNVVFEVYNSLGMLLQTIPDNNKDYGNVFLYELINSERSNIPIEDNNNLEKGLYRIRLTLNRIELSRSVYYLNVRIGNDIRTIKMVIN